MTDNWSLKDKRKRYNPEVGFFYEWDIETLRQKLIEDIKKEIATINSDTNKNAEQYEAALITSITDAIENNIILSINKRFGVDE